MLSPSRGPERLVRAGQWTIAVLFAWFLIQVGASVIADLPLLSRAPQLAQFRNEPALQSVQEQIDPLQDQRQRLQLELGELTRRRGLAQENLRRERQSFETWRAARAVTAQSDQNPEVLQRARQLDAWLERERQLLDEQRQLDQRQRALDARLEPLQRQRSSLERQGQLAYERALSRHQWTAFLIRLGFVLPVLALSLHLFRRHRGGEQWPFVWGFLLFALFAFFVELVPYLPSFGAYIRYGIGALLTYMGGRALMRWLRAYLQRKQSEQQAPQQERLQQIRYEKALQSLARRQCPSCERVLAATGAPLPDYCMHCGLPIQIHCRHCDHHHPAFYPYCSACGAPTERNEAPAVGS
ncbi:MAG: hypothetical protein VKI63_02635 [Cyanobium sp.]|nr:hypothetical protein [Cyanobium sp.]